MNDQLERVQIRELTSGKCLGTSNVAGNTIGLVDCDEKDILQRWDASDIYGKYGVFQKAYRVAEIPKPPFAATNTELSTTAPPGSRIYLGLGSNNEYVYSPANQTEYTFIPSTGAIKRIYAPENENNLDTCVNITNGRLTGNANRIIPYSAPNNNINCDTKWSLLYDCVGEAPHDGYVCNRETGEYVCAPGNYGADCSFRSTSETAEAAYNSFYEACVQGTMSHLNPSRDYPTIRETCNEFHKTQEWVEPHLRRNFYNAQRTTDTRLFDERARNSKSLLDLNDANFLDFQAQEIVTNNQIAAITTTKNNMTSAHKNNANGLNAQKNLLIQELDGLKRAPPFVPQESEEPLKSALANSRISVAALRGTLKSRTDAIDINTKKNKTLLDSYNDLLSRINRVVLPKL